MVVKRNQRRLWDDLDLFFRIPPQPVDQEVRDCATTVTKGHGRLETRTVECSTGDEYRRCRPRLCWLAQTHPDLNRRAAGIDFDVALTAMRTLLTRPFSHDIVIPISNSN